MTSRPAPAVTPTIVFGIAFGWVEAAVVVYLRRLYYPGGFRFPLENLPADLALVELVRELATLVMLGALGWAGARTAWGRFGLFAVAFGVWDLVYYAGLWIALGWPAALGDWDVLFLVPGIWTGPVWAPGLVAALLVVCGAVLFRRGEAGTLAQPRAHHWIMAAGSLIAVVGAFLANHDPVFQGGMPGPFPVALFVSGVAVGLAAFADIVRVRSAAAVPRTTGAVRSGNTPAPPPSG